MSDNTHPSIDTDRATTLAVGLRRLAAMFSDHPHLDPRWAFDRINVYISGQRDGDVRGRIVAFARAGLTCGATVTEHGDAGSEYAGVDVVFGPIGLHVYASVEKVHGVTRRTVEQGDDGVTCRITEYTPRSILAELTADPEERAA